MAIESWNRIIGLVIKEILVFVRDPRSRFVLIVPPVIQMFVFGYAATFDLVKVPFCLYDESRTLNSREFVSKFKGSPIFILKREIFRDSLLKEEIEGRKTLFVLHIDRRFNEDLLSGRSAKVQLIIDGRNSNTAAILSGYANQIISEFNAEWIKKAGLAPLPSQISFRSLYNPNLLSRWFIVPGLIAILTFVVSAMTIGLSIAREKEMGTFDQLLVTPLRPIEILVGKTIPGLLFAMAEATIILLAALLWFKIPFMGNMAILYLGLLFFLFAIMGIELAISSLASTQQQALLGVFFFLIPSIVLSGFSTPIRNMPELIQYLTFMNPMRYFLIIIRGVFLEGRGLDSLWNQFIPLFLIGLFSMSFSWYLFKKRIY
ncbi:ABC transporter permease [Candidatus Methylacidiphilum infernorum]|uniref:ABC transporter permease n=1 Tax=Candidatus Methylacidiphilum infernorum TaxID=511746 RepID=A0ABX7PVV9_9BACT|nr:ABC transporter permease [Candidatus Methylacidiphilum infernorum]QSR87107.1 ABC transporter permease [Candidatus Methylacidiphilum infernorum]